MIRGAPVLSLELIASLLQQPLSPLRRSPCHWPWELDTRNATFWLPELQRAPETGQVWLGQTKGLR